MMNDFLTILRVLFVFQVVVLAAVIIYGVVQRRRIAKLRTLLGVVSPDPHKFTEDK